MLVNMILACNQLCFFIRSEKNGFGTKVSFRSKPPLLKLDQDKVTALAHHRPQLCAVDEHLPVMNNLFVQWVTICSAVIRRSVPWVTTGFLKQHKKRTHCESFGRSWIHKTVDIGQFFRTRAARDAQGINIALHCKEFTQPKFIEGTRMIRNIPGNDLRWSRTGHGRLRGSWFALH